jgi:pimeloyl-ACP methyl ester carboxylesterase
MANDIHNIKVPVCLIWGRDDKITPPEVAVEFNQLLPDSELNWIDRCGHAPMMERPIEFNGYLKKFLDRIY